MSFFSRLFRKAPPVASAGKAADSRKPVATTSKAGVPRADAPRDIENIAALPVGERLFSLATGAAATQKAAQQRLAQLLDAGTLDMSRLSGQIKDPAVLLSIAAAATQPQHLAQAVTAIPSSDFWFKLVTGGSSARLRQLGAEQVTDPDQLRQLLKSTRGKDKNAYKIIRRKCDELQQQDKLVAERKAAVVALSESIERHSYKPFDGAFVATLEHLLGQWNALGAESPPELQPRVSQATERAREVISNHVQMVGAQAARVTAIENADPQRQVILDEMRDTFAALMVATPADVVELDAKAREQLAKWTDRWSGTTRHKVVSADDGAAFGARRDAIARLAQVIVRHGTLQQQLDAVRDAPADQDLDVAYRSLRATLSAARALPDVPPSESMLDAAALLQQVEQSQAAHRAAIDASLRQIGGLIRKAGYALNDGRSGQAAGLRRAIAESLPQLAVVPAHMTGQIEQLDKRLAELQDWKSYAVAPKRAELIAQMEALIGSTAEPEELAEDIRRLQDDWKSVTKGSAEQSDADWQKFHEAAQTAYQPCREYFAAQAQIREQNLERRRTLVGHLRTFDNAHDWANADWKEVARVLRSARQEWRNHNPTDRVATKPVQTEFDGLIKTMQDRLDAQYSNSIARKQSLIQQAKRLLTEPDTRKAIDDVKRLQQTWKSAGIVPHLEDQQLWDDFRQQCDAVYRKSQEEYSKFAAELEANKAHAVALIEQASALSQLEGAALTEAGATLRQLRADFETIGELPRAESADLQRQFQRAFEQHESSVSAQRAQAERQGWNDLFAASNEIRLLQLATLENPADNATLRQSVQASIDGVQKWPKGGLQAIEQKLAQAPSVDVAANIAALRTLCIRAEILTGTPTPAADQTLRRNFQLQSLVKDFGQSGDAGREQFATLVFDWVAVGPTPTSDYYELLERFNGCWTKVQRV